MKAQIYKKLGLWIRRVPKTWEESDVWRTDIRPSILSDASLNDALFVLEDGTLIFIEMTQMKLILENKAPSSNGSITFDVNPYSKHIDEKSVKMHIIPTKDNANDLRIAEIMEY